jgi:GrpB-like predicted nucleotidyltransferase (UPF0157 family)
MTSGPPAFDGRRWSNAAADVVALAPADPTWPARFAAEADAIRAALGAAAAGVTVEHVGSTAVAGLAAKPVIDLLLIPPDGVWPRDAFVAALPALGYAFWADDPDPEHLFFVKGMPPYGTGRTHHVHVRPRARAAPVLAFRDHLRARPDAARAYEALKRALAAAHPTDREAYTRGKDAFVARALAEVAAAGGARPDAAPPPAAVPPKARR